MLNDLVNNVITVNIDSIIDYPLPLNEKFGLKIINNQTVHEFIIKLSDEDENLVFLYSDDENYLTLKDIYEKLSDKNSEIENLNEIIRQKDEELSEIATSKDLKISNLREMLIQKDDTLLKLTNALEETNIKKQIDNMETMQEQIKVMDETIEENNTNINSLNDEIDLLKSIIAEKDKTIESLKMEIYNVRIL